MPPDERRAAIVDATVPLVMAYGAEVSTRQIAEASGLAEGTLFRVFPNKEAIVQACVDRILDPDDLVADIAAIDRTLPLTDQLDQLVVRLRASGDRVARMMAVLHRRPTPPRHHDGDPADHERRWDERRRAPVAAITALLAPHADALRVEVPVAVMFVRGLVFSATFPLFVDDVPDDATLADLVRHAICKEP